MAGAELNKDMISIKKKTLTVMTPEGGTLQDYAFREAPYVFYRNGLYYFMWSVDDTGSPNYHVAYGTLNRRWDLLRSLKIRCTDSESGETNLRSCTQCSATNSGYG